MIRKGKMLKAGIYSCIFTLLFLTLLAACNTPTESGQKTLKIGVLAFLGYPPGIDFTHGLEAVQDMENKNGGLEIGGNKYEIQFIVYDSNSNQATAAAAINRLIFEDKVKFILADAAIVDPWLSITETNKVLVCAGAYTPEILKPENKYCFQTGFSNCGNAALWGWFSKTYPDKKNLVFAFPDNQMGHAMADTLAQVPQIFGFKTSNIFYPASSQDQSAVGTKVKVANPDVFMSLDEVVYKAAWDAGYKGQFFFAAAKPYTALSAIIPAEALEGFIAAAWPTEFDPALTDPAQEFKDAYAAKFSEWDNLEIQGLGTWYCLKAALQKTKSLDVDTVAAVIGNGITFEGPNGKAQMVSRPDLGNNRTIDSIVGYSLKKIENGKIKLIETISLDDTRGFFEYVYKKQ